MRVGECTVGCGACCRSIRLQVPPSYSQDADIRKWIELHGIRLSERDGGTFAQIDIACSALTSEGMCSLIDSPERPELCSHWPATPAALEGLEEVCTFSFVGGPQGNDLQH